jgi:hypothetical protein
MALVATAAINCNGRPYVKGNKDSGRTEELHYSRLIRDETEAKTFGGSDDFIPGGLGGSVLKVASAKSTHNWGPLNSDDNSSQSSTLRPPAQISVTSYTIPLKL